MPLFDGALGSQHMIIFQETPESHLETVIQRTLELLPQVSSLLIYYPLTYVHKKHNGYK